MQCLKGFRYSDILYIIWCSSELLTFLFTYLTFVSRFISKQNHEPDAILIILISILNKLIVTSFCSDQVYYRAWCAYISEYAYSYHKFFVIV